MVKAVLQALPSFVMSLFKIPTEIVNEIEKLIKHFWWSQDLNTRKMHWIKWEALIEIKKHGGMGFQEMQKFNEAL